jgi:hypothetical protein
MNESVSRRPVTVVGVPASPYATGGMLVGTSNNTSVSNKVSDTDGTNRRAPSSVVGVSVSSCVDGVGDGGKDVSLRRRIRYVDDENQQAAKKTVSSPSSSYSSSSVSPRMHQVCRTRQPVDF